MSEPVPKLTALDIVHIGKISMLLPCQIFFITLFLSVFVFVVLDIRYW